MHIGNIVSWNPFGWAWLKPPTQSQIILHEMKETKRKISDARLEAIKLHFEHETLTAQFKYLQDGTLPPSL